MHERNGSEEIDRCKKASKRSKTSIEQIVLHYLRQNL